MIEPVIEIFGKYDRTVRIERNRTENRLKHKASKRESVKNILLTIR